jgi:hypothetical protein
MMMMFRIAWWLLFVSTSLFALNHVIGAATFATSGDETVMFLIFAALNLLTLVVLLEPYRDRERWAWWAVWIPIAAMFVGPLVFGLGPITVIYCVGGVVMAAAHLMAARQMLRTRASLRRG